MRNFSYQRTSYKSCTAYLLFNHFFSIDNNEPQLDWMAYFQSHCTFVVALATLACMALLTVITICAYNYQLIEAWMIYCYRKEVIFKTTNHTIQLNCIYGKALDRYSMW